MEDNEASSVDGVIFTNTCDAVRLLRDVWQTYVPVPVVSFFEFPRQKTSHSVRYAIQSLYSLIKDLEHFSGQTLRAEELSYAVRVYNKQRELRLIWRTEWLKGHIALSDYLAFRKACLTQDPEIQREPVVVDSSAMLSTSRLPRILLLGSLSVRDDLVLLIHELGGRVFGEDSDIDERAITAEICSEGTIPELLEKIVLTYFEMRPSPYDHQVARRVEYIDQLITDRQIDAVIFSYYKFCDPFFFFFPAIKKTLDRRNIPILLLEDVAEARISGQMRTRLEAFLEML